MTEKKKKGQLLKWNLSLLEISSLEIQIYYRYLTLVTEYEKLNKEKRSFPKEASVDTHIHTDIHVHLGSHLARLAGSMNDSLWGQQMIRSICTLLSSSFCLQSFCLQASLFFLAPGLASLLGPGSWCTLESHIQGANTLLRRTLLSLCIVICITYHARTWANHQLMTKFQEKTWSLNYF